MTDLADILDDDDLFDVPLEHPKYGLDERGSRYRFPNPDGTPHPGGWQRCTNMTSSISDMRALMLWRERMVSLGLRDNDDLYDELCSIDLENMSPDDAKAKLNALADQAADAAGAGRGARRGTARHAMVELYHQALEPTGHGRMRQQLESLKEAYAAHRLEPVPELTERTICIPEFNVVGRFDTVLMCQDTGALVIGDLKTEAKFWGWLEKAAQQACYNHAKWMWDGPLDDSGRWVPMPEKIRKDVAVLMHMPAQPGPGQLPVQLWEVDTEYGWRVAQLAHQVVQLRAEGALGPVDARRSKRKPTGWLRPQPAPRQVTRR